MTTFHRSSFYTTSIDTKSENPIVAAFAKSINSLANIGQFFYEKTIELIDLNAWTLAGDTTKAVDLVRDVLNAAPIAWITDEVGGQSVSGSLYLDSNAIGWPRIKILDFGTP